MEVARCGKAAVRWPRQGLRIVAVIGTAVVVLLGGGVGTPGGAIAEKPRRPGAASLELGAPPAKVPVALLQNGSRSGAWLFQRGMLFKYNWLVEGTGTSREAKWPPWPQEAPDPVSPLTVSLQTASVPDQVVVKVFDESSLRKSVPARIPLDEIDCSWQYDRAPDCLVRLSDGSVGVRVGKLPPAAGYRLVVFASWLAEVESGTSDATDRPTHVTAAWLFSLGQRRPEES